MLENKLNALNWYCEGLLSKTGFKWMNYDEHCSLNVYEGKQCNYDKCCHVVVLEALTRPIISTLSGSRSLHT